MDQETHFEWLSRLVRTADRRAAPFDYDLPVSGERRTWRMAPACGESAMVKISQQ